MQPLSFPVDQPKLNVSLTGLSPPGPERFDPFPLSKRVPDPIALAAEYRCTDKTTFHGHVARVPAKFDSFSQKKTPPVTVIGGGVVNKDGLMKGKEVSLSGSNYNAHGRNFHQSATVDVGKKIAPGITGHLYASVGNASGKGVVGAGVKLSATPN